MAQTNDEETSFEKEVIIKKTLNEYAKTEYNVSLDKNKAGYPSWEAMRKDYIYHNSAWQVYFNDMEKLAKIAVSNSRLDALDDCKTLLERVLSETELDPTTVAYRLELKDEWCMKDLLILDRKEFEKKLAKYLKAKP
jgi:hypothetical protein